MNTTQIAKTNGHKLGTTGAIGGSNRQAARELGRRVTRDEYRAWMQTRADRITAELPEGASINRVGEIFSTGGHGFGELDYAVHIIVRSLDAA